MFPHTHFNLHPIVILEREVKLRVAQSCPTLCEKMDYTVHGILQARILEWVAVPFSRRSFQPRDQTQISLIAGGFFTTWTRREVILEFYTIHGWLNLWIQRVNCKLYMDFWLQGGSLPLAPSVVQGSTIIFKMKLSVLDFSPNIISHQIFDLCLLCMNNNSGYYHFCFALPFPLEKF